MNNALASFFRKSNFILNRVKEGATDSIKHVMLRRGIVPPPFRIQIDITDKCNFRCPTCSKWTHAEPSRELRLEDWKKALEKIKSFSLFEEITICGGEPFERPDLLEILECAKEKKFYLVLITNGWFVNADVLRRLGEMGVNRLMVSLNSLKESVHDESRSMPGSYDRIMRLLEVWKKQRQIAELYLATVIMEQNCGELSDFAVFVRDEGLTGIIFQVLASKRTHYPFSKHTCINEATAEWHVCDPAWVRSIDTLRSEIKRLLFLKSAGIRIENSVPHLQKVVSYYSNPEAIRKLPCLGTLSRLYIDPFGNMRLCYGFPPIGNVLRDNPREVWRSDKANQVRLMSRACNRMCRMMNNNL